MNWFSLFCRNKETSEVYNGLLAKSVWPKGKSIIKSGTEVDINSKIMSVFSSSYTKLELTKISGSLFSIVGLVLYRLVKKIRPSYIFLDISGKNPDVYYALAYNACTFVHKSSCTAERKQYRSSLCELDINHCEFLANPQNVNTQLGMGVFITDKIVERQEISRFYVEHKEFFKYFIFVLAGTGPHNLSTGSTLFSSKNLIALKMPD